MQWRNLQLSSLILAYSRLFSLIFAYLRLMGEKLLSALRAATQECGLRSVPAASASRQVRVSKSLTPEAFGNPRGHGRCAFLGGYIHPGQMSVSAKPGELALGKLARADLHQLDGFRQRSFAAQVFRDLAVTDGLHRRAVGAQAALKHALGFRHQ